MESRIRRARQSRLTLIALASSLVSAAAAVCACALASATGASAAPPQDVIRVESRLTQLEQRLFSIEANLRLLQQQQAQLSNGAGRTATTNDAELNALRSDVDALRRRLAEAECGLAKVDERTLAPAERATRRKTVAGADDPCRLNPDAPVRLSSRP